MTAGTAVRASVIAALVTVAACSMPDGGANRGQEGPDIIKSADGALAFYQGVQELYGIALNDAAHESGLLADELRPSLVAGVYNNGHPMGIDARVLPEGIRSLSFAQLQVVRENARQARAVLARYAPAAPSALTGHLYAIEGLADVLLADLYCSGIPLSTINADGSFTLAAGSTTEEVYRTAIALFDTAITLSADSARILNFARVGKGRALLSLSLDSAAAAARTVHDVPTDYRYEVEGNILPFSLDHPSDPSYGNSETVASGVVMSDHEGGTGLPYATGGDPRTAADTASRIVEITPADGGAQDTIFALYPRYYARKYSIDGATPMVVASGVEARLIEAEADLHAHGAQWLSILNNLRATMASTALPTLDDPGASPGDTARVSRLFDERAYWLFLTAHRQGDLRRLVRAAGDGGYGRTQARVYPSGAYPGGGFYGQDVTLPVPSEELQRNPHYSGCRNREA